MIRSANASPGNQGFHYAPARSPLHSPSRISAAARRPSISPATTTASALSPSSPLVPAAAAAAVSQSPPRPSSQPCLHGAQPRPSPRQSQQQSLLLSQTQSAAKLHPHLHSQPQPQPQPPVSFQRPPLPRRYEGVDAATQYSPMEPFDYAAHPHRHSSSSQAAPQEKQPPPPTAPGPALAQPGVEQGTEGSGIRQALAASTLANPVHPTASFVSSPASESILATNASNHPPTSSDPTSSTTVAFPLPPPPPPPALPQTESKPSPNKRRSSQDLAGSDGNTSSFAPAAGTSSEPNTTDASESNAKRPRPEAAPPKILPERYELCPVEDMVVLIANMLGELIETNDGLALKSGHLTRFHSRTAPGISVLDYLHRLAKHATLTPPLLLSMVYYIDRLCAMYPDFTINTLTVHRFLITAATVAAKGLSDSFWNNTTYARVGGVRVAELKMLELEFLYRLEWKIVPNPEVLAAYYRPLVERCPGYVLPPDRNPAQVQTPRAGAENAGSGTRDTTVGNTVNAASSGNVHANGGNNKTANDGITTPVP